MASRVITLTILIKLFMLLTLASSQTTGITSQCLSCICQALGSCDYLKGCVRNGPTLHCGPLQLTWAYWADAGKPGANGHQYDFENCATNKACAERTVMLYTNRYGQDCDGDGRVTCNDLAILHRTGYASCQLNRVRNTAFWQTFSNTQCYHNNISNQPHNRNTRRSPSSSAVHFPSEPVGSHRSFTTSTNFNPFNRESTNFARNSDSSSPPSSLPVRMIRPASRFATQPTSPRVNPLLNGPLRVVNHFDQPIGLSRTLAVQPSTSERNRPVSNFNGPAINSLGSNNNIHRNNRNLQPSPMINETHYVTGLSNQCLRCICEASTGCDLRQRCNGQFCGPFLLSWPYWQDSGSPGPNFLSCANNFHCAQSAVRAYMRKHAQDCDRNGRLTCEDFAAVHQLGGASCAVGWERVRTSLYWNNFKRCYGTGDNGNRDREVSVVRHTHIQPSPPQPSSFPQPVPQPPPSSSTNGFSIEDRPEEDPGNDLGDFRDIRRIVDSENWRPVLGNAVIHNSIVNEHSPNSLLDQPNHNHAFSSTAAPPISYVSTPPTTRRPLNSFTPPPRPPPRAFEIVTDSHSNSFEHNSPNSNGNHLLNSFHNQPINFNNRSPPSQITPPFSPAGQPPPSPMISAGNGQLEPSTTISPRPDTHRAILNLPTFNLSVEQSCLDCICEATSNCDLNFGCRTNEFGEFVCGAYHLNRFFWTEAGRPRDGGRENSFELCVLDKECAELTIKSYANRHQIDCNDDGVLDCLDFAALHKLGKAACNLQNLLDSTYWNKFQQCYGFGDD